MHMSVPRVRAFGSKKKKRIKHKIKQKVIVLDKQ